MKAIFGHACFAVAIILTATAANAQTDDLNIFWKNGLNVETAERDIQLKFGGRVQYDWAYFLDDAFGDDNDDELRRLRLYMQGLLYDRVEFKVQYDFAGSDPQFKDVYIGLTNLDFIGGLRFGHFKEPFGLEQLTSTKYITFVERSLPDIFTPERNVGVMLHNQLLDDRLTYALGVFADTEEFGNDFNGDAYSITGRLTGLPWYENEGARLLHLGLSLTYRDLDDKGNPADPTDPTKGAKFEYSVRPESHLADKILKAKFFSNEPENQITLAPELALVYGPFSLQGEYTYTNVSQNTVADVDLSGFYVQGSYFLTGEHRNYKTSSAAFDRLSPKANFLSADGGWGAWEAALRYSQVDLKDGNLLNAGGEVNDVAFALNWYLNPNMRVMWNFIHAELDGLLYNGEDEDNAVQMRFQVAY